MKKALTLIAVIFVIAALIAIPCGAESIDGIGEAVSAEGNVKAEAVSAEASDIPTGADSAADGEQTEGEEPVQGSAANIGKDSSHSEENVFSSIYSIAMEHIGEIFACLACLFSGVLMLCYKKGILPLISGGISALRGGVSELSREAQRQTESSQGISNILKERFAKADSTLEKMEEALSTLTEKLAKNDTKRESQLFRTVLLAEVNMLYEVFMAATLPEYQKERITEEVNAMRARLTEAGENEEN